MLVCVNCGERVAALYRRYCPSVLKLLKCEKCDFPADKYIEYDPVIVLVDVILIEKRAYRHLLYNSDFINYWKLMIALWLCESLRLWSCCNSESEDARQGRTNCNFYISLLNTAAGFGVFACTVLAITEMSRRFSNKREKSDYNVRDAIRALTIGGCGKLLGLLGVVWTRVASGPHYLLIEGYTALCLLTAYSVVTKNDKTGGLIGISSGLMAYNYVSNCLSTTSTNIPGIGFAHGLVHAHAT